MKRFFAFRVALVMLLALSCSKEFDDTEIWNSINLLEQRVSAMETVMRAYENNLFIESVSQIENGYVITFSDGSKATIVNGKDGVDGTDGKDGVDGKDGDTYIDSISIGENEVTFILTDGKSFSITLYSALSIEFDFDDSLVVATNSVESISYSIKSIIDDVVIEVISSGDVKAKVVPETSLIGDVEIIVGNIIDEYSKVIVLVSNGEKVIMRSISFEEQSMVVEENPAKHVKSSGGEVTLEFLSNVECDVVIPSEAESWISVVPETRAMERHEIRLNIAENDGYNRSANVVVTPKNNSGSLKLEYTIKQTGDLGGDPETIPNNEIWYVAKNYIGVDMKLPLYKDLMFDANIVSHTYEDGLYVIRFDKDITKIHCGSGSLFFAPPSGILLKKFYLPQSVVEFSSRSNPFGILTESLDAFYGKFASEDNRCLIVDGKIVAFASSGLEEYTTPKGVVEIGDSAFNCSTLRKITISEGVKSIGDHAFGTNGVPGVLEYVYLPSTVEDIGVYAFHHNPVKKFEGECKLITDDGYGIIEKNGYLGLNWLDKFAAGAGLTTYTIPDEVGGIQNYCFDGAESLTSLTFPKTVVEIGPAALLEANNIERIYGDHILSDNRSYVVDNNLLYVADKGITEYVTPDCVEQVAEQVFAHKQYLESITLSDNVTTTGGYGYLFRNSDKLHTITISARMKILGFDPFGSFACKNLKTIYLRAPIPPHISHTSAKNEIPTLFPNLTIYVPMQSLEQYMSSAHWEPYKGYIKGYNYTDLPADVLDHYVSTDYSKDGVVATLQTATRGEGIDIVLMGDAYSDRQIADGTYQSDMEYLYDNLFTEEPYKSFKDHFNVYYVNVVSATEGYDYGSTALGGFFGDGTLVGGDDYTAFYYAQKAISGEEVDEALIIVAMNSDNYAGTCYMYYPTNATGTYGSGAAVAYFPRGGNQTTFAQVLHHEACGHGFAKLADEYAYEYMGAVPNSVVSDTKAEQSSLGWWKNVDFTNNPATILWSHFLADERYANEGLGAYEGSLTYWSGVWRPTDNSIMRYNTGGFNAPSREAIYYRIHKLAYGDSWEYDYEKFVEWDARNRVSAATRNAIRKPANYKPTHEPIVMQKTWKDAR